ncbi:MAG: lipoyl synthase, partial [Opitutaceae bacterium]|nr:lipoyl synthase [Opitutaceae bacterium]
MDTTRKPSWIRVKFPTGSAYQATLRMVKEHKLHTICQSAGCPNIGECWSRGTATLMILGEICTRSCNFCAVKTGRPTEPDIYNHNIETVERLQKPVRVTARYDRSRSVLRHAKSRGFTTKTGFMLGLGEEQPEIEQTMSDLAGDKIDILTIGQYLQPSPEHWPLARWVRPEEFQHWKQIGLSLGFGVVESGPLVRSSYHADEQSQKYTGVEHLN